MNEHKAGAAAPKRSEQDKVRIVQHLTLTKRIGKGQLGTVYAAVHSVLARRFAVKVLRGSLTRDENTLTKLRYLVRETSTVVHPFVTSLTDFGQLSDGRFYLTMDFVRGLQLTKVLERDGRMPLGRAIPLLIQLAGGLEAAHRLRVVHGDVKPNNIMLVEERQGAESLRLNDFALVRSLSAALDKNEPAVHLRLYGNLDYIAPEVISGGQVDGRADIYAFGCTAYRMLTGEPPFVGDLMHVMEAHRERDPVPPSRRSGAHGVPPGMDALILRCLQKQPADRYDTMEEIAWELQELQPVSRRAVGLGFEEEEVTGRWELPPELQEQQNEEPLPESPARLRRLFYDTIFELSVHAEEQALVNEQVVGVIAAVRELREESSRLGAQAELTENRFEDIRRELRERESALRYAIIDLNLAKSDQLEHGGARSDVDQQIAELEARLSQLGRDRRDRFAELNVELQQAKDGIKSLEQDKAIHYRRLYAELDEVRAALNTAVADRHFRLLERCRNALAEMHREQSRTGENRTVA